MDNEKSDCPKGEVMYRLLIIEDDRGIAEAIKLPGKNKIKLVMIFFLTKVITYQILGWQMVCIYLFQRCNQFLS